jgi:membrane protease YdiL (CAAX protease family)
VGVGLIVAGGILTLAIEHWVTKKISPAQGDFILPPDEGPPPADAPVVKAEPAPAAEPPRSLLTGAIGMVLLAGFATPFCEEILFRGVVYDWLAERLWLPLAVAISAAAFGLAHLRYGMVVAVVTGVCGVVLALAYHYSQTLWAPIIIHSVFNAPKIVVLYALRARGIRLATG